MTSASFDAMSPGYDVANALRLAHAASLSYKDEADVEAQAREWGFDDFRHFRVTHKPPFPLEDTQAYAIAKDNMVILEFRGTEPAEIRDWLSDANAPQVPVTNGKAHWGFHTALDAVYEPTREAITALRDRDQSLWVTGHSLGGALAMLAAARLHFAEPSLSADGVYTFGQPAPVTPPSPTPTTRLSPGGCSVSSTTTTSFPACPRSPSTATSRWRSTSPPTARAVVILREVRRLGEWPHRRCALPRGGRRARPQHEELHRAPHQSRGVNRGYS